MSYQFIEFDIEDGVGLLRLNRPDHLNSFNAEMHSEMRNALRTVRNTPDIRCLLLTGNGRGFCAGQDLHDRAINPEDDLPNLGESIARNYNPLIRALRTLPLPVVCAVNGVAAGAGANIALACDLVYAARSARFVQAFSRIGLVPDSGGTWILPRLVGHARATALCMLADKISAEQAQDWGMIWQCVDDEALMETALNTAKHLATQPTRGLALTKRALNASYDHTLDEQLELERVLQSQAGRTEDYREGVAAFMEKRSPHFQGR